MASIKMDEQILKRFCQGRCNRSEAEAIARYLKLHLEVLNTLFEDDEWLIFLNNDETSEVPYDEQVIWDNIRRKGLGSTWIIRWSFPRSLKWVAVAGALIFAILFSLRYHTESSEVGEMKSGLVKIVRDSVIWHNGSLQMEKRMLSDSSFVYLEAGGTLRYRESFQSNVRLLNLVGSAKFVVSRDPRRPFTVVSGKVSTTALGTIFSVDYPAKGNGINVRLWKGKVVVRNIQHVESSVYLLPGEACVFDGATFNKTISPSPVKRTQKRQAAMRVKKEYPDTTYQLDDTSATFKDAVLSVVFNTIEKLYHIDILYDSVPKPVISKSLYSGKFNREEMSPIAVLRILTNLNDLDFEQIDKKSFRILSSP